MRLRRLKSTDTLRMKVRSDLVALTMCLMLEVAFRVLAVERGDGVVVSAIATTFYLSALIHDYYFAYPKEIFLRKIQASHASLARIAMKALKSERELINLLDVVTTPAITQVADKRFIN
jgi:hypothetical protein